MHGEPDKTIVLGPEYDEHLQARLRDVVRDLGGVVLPREWGVGGSQEVSIIQVTIDGHALTIEAETYIGLSIIGPAALVDNIQARLSRNDDSKGSPD